MKATTIKSKKVPMFKKAKHSKECVAIRKKGGACICLKSSYLPPVSFRVKSKEQRYQQAMRPSHPRRERSSIPCVAPVCKKSALVNESLCAMHLDHGVAE